MPETLAASLFRLKGYRIVERRYRSPVGEIDLVAIRSKRLVFVGVKRRETKDEAAFAVTAKQKRRSVHAAQHWLASLAAFINHTTAFDVVLAAPWTWPRHVENAFPV